MKKKQFGKKRTPYLLLGILSVILVLMTLLLYKFQTSQQQKSDQSEKFINTSPLTVAESKKMWQNVFAKSTDLKKTYKEFVVENKKAEPSQQHLGAHIVGEVLYERIGSKGIAICDGSFTFGCYHGLESRAIADNGISEVGKLDKECVTLGPSWVSACRHGIGHGLVEFFGHKDDRLIEALNLCPTEGDNVGKENYSGCLTGVFMEYNMPTNITSNKSETTIRSIPKDDMYYPCVSVDQKFQPACFYQLSQLWELSNRGKYKKLGELCETVSNKDNLIACYRGIGDIIGPRSNFDPEIAETFCEELSSQFGQTKCKQSAAISILGQFGSAEKAKIVCRKLSENDRKNCLGESQ